MYLGIYINIGIPKWYVYHKLKYVFIYLWFSLSIYIYITILKKKRDHVF